MTRIFVILMLFAVMGMAQDDEKPEDIVYTLMPNGVPTELKLPHGADSRKAILQLKSEQKHVEGKRAQQIAFLLAVMKSDYEQDRDYLVSALDGCSAVPAQDCDEDTAAFVIALDERGDASVLPALLRAGKHADGALAAALGNFYAEILTQDSKSFVSAIESLPAAEQRHSCSLASMRDGGGMSPEERATVRESLQAIRTEAAARCSGAIAQGAISGQTP